MPRLSWYLDLSYVILLRAVRMIHESRCGGRFWTILCDNSQYFYYKEVKKSCKLKIAIVYYNSYFNHSGVPQGQFSVHMVLAKISLCSSIHTSGEIKNTFSRRLCSRKSCNETSQKFSTIETICWLLDCILHHWIPFSPSGRLFRICLSAFLTFRDDSGSWHRQTSFLPEFPFLTHDPTWSYSICFMGFLNTRQVAVNTFIL